MFKSVKTYLVIALIMLIAGSSFAGEYKKYQVKSGKVVYKMSGNAEGETITYWDDYGYKEVQFSKTKTKIWGMTNEENKTVLTLGSEVYTWKEGDDKVYKAANPAAEIWEEENYDEKDVEEFSFKAMESLGFKKTGEEKLDGKLCDVYEGMGKIWIWKKNGIGIKTDLTVMGIHIISDLVDMELDIKVDKKLFKYPENLTIVDETNMQEMMEEQDSSDEEMSPEEIEEAKEAAKQMLKGLFGK